jgi:hypothetical protein
MDRLGKFQVVNPNLNLPLAVKSRSGLLASTSNIHWQVNRSRRTHYGGPIESSWKALTLLSAETWEQSHVQVLWSIWGTRNLKENLATPSIMTSWAENSVTGSTIPFPLGSGRFFKRAPSLRGSAQIFLCFKLEGSEAPVKTRICILSRCTWTTSKVESNSS